MKIVELSPEIIADTIDRTERLARHVSPALQAIGEAAIRRAPCLEAIVTDAMLSVFGGDDLPPIPRFVA